MHELTISSKGMSLSEKGLSSPGRWMGSCEEPADEDLLAFMVILHSKIVT
jgi:hypothetical protein